MGDSLCTAFTEEAWTGAPSEDLCSTLNSVFLQGGKRQENQKRARGKKIKREQGDLLTNIVASRVPLVTHADFDNISPIWRECNNQYHHAVHVTHYI